MSIFKKGLVRSWSGGQADAYAHVNGLPCGVSVWPEGEAFMPTRQLVSKLIAHNGEYWGSESPYGKPLTETRLGRLVSQASKVTSARPGGPRPARVSPINHGAGLAPAWDRSWRTR